MNMEGWIFNTPQLLRLRLRVRLGLGVSAIGIDSFALLPIPIRQLGPDTFNSVIFSRSEFLRLACLLVLSFRDFVDKLGRMAGILIEKLDLGRVYVSKMSNKYVAKSFIFVGSPCSMHTIVSSTFPNNIEWIEPPSYPNSIDESVYVSVILIRRGLSNSSPCSEKEYLNCVT